ncbi:MAG: 4-alpha-glucanotransferase [Clostridia bacterium]|nr:4-alpha-glucanotransferase [Clostridia bacterium]
MQRTSGVLLPLTSLPGRYACGTVGDAAYRFVDALAAGGFSLWQMLPITPPDAYGSPYAGASSFALDERLLDPETLVVEGLLSREEAASPDREATLGLAAERLGREVLDATLAENPLLAAYCRRGGEDGLYRRALCQYVLDRALAELHRYAGERGVSLVGDLPFYVAADSVDLSLFPSAFSPSGEVAGVPPDAFAPEGQVWGNPLYDFSRMREDNYAYFRARLSYLLDRFDGVRLNHFRGYSAYYAVPKETSAAEGRWEAGPGRDLFAALSDLLAGRLVIAEDLGTVDGAVDALRRDCGFLSTRVLQFGFLGDPTSPHLPYRYTEDVAAYTGTHDNDTLQNYIATMPEGERRYLLDYCGASTVADGTHAAVRTVLASSASLAIFPVQDLLGLSGEARINTPGRAEGNWGFRMSEEQLAALESGPWLYYNRLYGRK